MNLEAGQIITVDGREAYVPRASSYQSAQRCRRRAAPITATHAKIQAVTRPLPLSARNLLWSQQQLEEGAQPDDSLTETRADVIDVLPDDHPDVAVV
jgi:hypothetical protein